MKFSYTAVELEEIRLNCTPGRPWIPAEVEVDVGVMALGPLVSQMVSAIVSIHLMDLESLSARPTRALQKRHLKNVARLSHDLVVALADKRFIGTNADIFPTIRSSLEGSPLADDFELEILASLMAIRTAAGMMSSGPNKTLENSIRNKSTYWRFRLSADLLHNYKHMTGKDPTKTLHPTPSGYRPSEAIRFLRASINPVLKFVGEAQLTEDAAQAEIKQVKAAWKNGLDVQSDSFHRRGSGVYPNRP